MPQTSPQLDVFAFLENPAAYGRAAGDQIKRIDTHAAAVFLAGGYVFKVKRAVKFPFLDFSTLDKRKAALEAEIEANKPFAPELYLGLVPVVRDGAKLALGGDGEAVEWALKMRRFDETQTLDHLADAGKVDTPMAADLARIVATAHERAPKVEAGPWIAALSEYIEQNDRACREHANIFDPEETERLTKASRDAFTRLRPLLEKRGAHGMIRRGHGDLHLGNIALIDGRPVPFDALEFDPLVASGDLLYDLAFLLMDLDQRKLIEAAATAFNTYFAASQRDSDIEALAALPLFMSVRAAIRAKVTAAKLANADEAKREAIAKEAQTYFKLACKLIAPPKPKLVAVGGLSGTGKSVLARAFSAHLPPLPGALVLRSDVERKVMFGKGETEKLPPEAYTGDVTTRVYKTVTDKAKRVIAAGHSAIVDAVFAKPQERELISTLARDNGFDFHGLFLTADIETRIRRVGGRIGDASDANPDIARKQEEYDLGTLDWHKVDASGTPEETLKNALAKLKA